MGLGQVADMYIVPNTRPVGRIVIRPKDRHVGAPPTRYREDERDQMGLRGVAFAQLALRVRPRRIKIAQADPAQPVRRSARLEHTLDKQLTLTIRIYGAEGMLF